MPPTLICFCFWFVYIELIKMVAYNLQNSRHALHACLLVSRAWSRAAVEFLYKAEHMMNDFDFQHLPTLSFASSASLSVDMTVLKNAVDELGDPLRSRYRPILACLDAGHAIGTVDGADDPAYKICLSPDMVTQLLLKRTLEASLLHDASCTYDYISYLNKISCPVSAFHLRPYPFPLFPSFPRSHCFFGASNHPSIE